MYYPEQLKSNNYSLFTESQLFIKQYFKENNLSSDLLNKRLNEIQLEIELTDSYTHTTSELEFGAQVAWRNSNRCIGRLHYKQLVISDLREVSSPVAFESALKSHIEIGFNNGKIKPFISIFQPNSFKIINKQLIGFAAFANGKTLLGDPSNLKLTQFAQKLGWTPKQLSAFEILPIIYQTADSKFHWFELNSESIPMVKLQHPEFEAFNKLNLSWYAVPIISDMDLYIGGIKYQAAPFNGWYMGTEIGARNLTDENRYNLLPQIAQSFGIEPVKSNLLWKDLALAHLNKAVLYSFKKAGVSMVDHHTACLQFEKFQKNEALQNRTATGDWSWLIPPTAASLSSIFHHNIQNKLETPNFFYRESNYFPIPQQSCPVMH